MDSQKKPIDVDPLAKALQGIVDSNESELQMAKSALHYKDDQLTTVKEAFATAKDSFSTALQAKDD